MISSILSCHLFDYALNTLWQLPLLAASTWLLIRLARPSAPLQHTLWIATLLLAATLPLRTPPVLIRPAVLLPVPPTALTLPTLFPVVVTLPRPTTLQNFPHPQAITLAPRVICRVTQLWLALLAFNILRLILALNTSRRLIRRARSSHSTLDPTLLATCASRLQIRVPEVLLLPATDDTAVPSVAGLSIRSSFYPFA